MKYFKLTWAMTIAVVALFLSCGNGNPQEEKIFLLSGKLSGLTSSQLYLINMANPNQGPVDTANVAEDGSFSFDYQPANIGFYRLNLSQRVAVILPLQSGDQVRLSGDAATVGALKVEGSKNAERMASFNLFLQNINQKQNQLNIDFQAYASHPKVDSILIDFRGKYESLEEEKANYIRSLIDEDASLFANIAIMEQLPAKGNANIAAFKKVNDALSSQYGDSPFYRSFQNRVNDALKFAPGTDVPEINLPNPNGDYVALSSLKGKVVLVDFWASWCKPCRMENPNVVAAYQKYKDKGFTVYGVSLDRTKDAWVRAIEQDNLTWTHVSDLKFWQSEAAQAYGVRGIPFALLLDTEGKVIGKNLRGAELHKKLAEVLD